MSDLGILQPLPPPQPHGDERRHLEELQALYTAIDELHRIHDAIATMRSPDLAPVVGAVEGLHPLLAALRAGEIPVGPSPEVVAEEVGRRVAATQGPLVENLSAIAEQIRKLHRKVSAAAMGGGGGVGLTNDQLRSAPVDVTTDALTNSQLRAAPVVVSDDYQTGEVLADQSGPGVLTFTFSATVQLVVVEAYGTDGQAARVDPFGGTPAASTGLRCDHGTPTYLPVATSAVKVYAPSGMSVSVSGFRRS